MNSLEKLEEEAYENGVEVISHPFESDRIKGLYCDNVIALSKGISSSTEKECVLMEEMAHHYTSTGNIIDINDTSNRKQELRARFYAYNRKVGLQGIIKCHNARCHTLADMAECLDVTEQFLKDAIHCYRSKYGTSVQVDNYVILFEPTLMVIEQFQQI